MDKFSLRRSIAQTQFTNVVWESETKGTCECPGASAHTNEGRSCEIFIDKRVTVYCHHRSCEHDIAEANEEFRRNVWEAESDPNIKFIPTEEDRKRWAEERRPWTQVSITELIVRLAQENRTWGYSSIDGALLNLGHRKD